ncbi:MAG: pyridoxal phosphate-dependent aminotransferase [Parcubacteria group bacterium]|nr:pyridoxal phosphate-dependent aminotransferase [Parcubacteria group bacterium]
MSPKISQRASSAQASPLRKLVPLANAAKERGTKVYHLNIGQPDIDTPKEIRKAIENFDEKTVAYAPSDGIAECKSAWEKYYKDSNIDLKAEDIIVTTGGSEAISFAMSVVCDPHEEVIAFEPFYTNYNGFASLVGCKVVPVKTNVEDGFRLPKKEAIEEKISDKTKAIIVCNPNNPTGTIYTKEEMQVIADIAREHNLFILSDETYREFNLDGDSRVTSMLDIEGVEDRVIIQDSISKRFSSCGARIGCLASKNKDVIACALKFGQARLSVATVEQLAAVPALENSKELVPPVVEEYRKRRDTVYEGLQKIEGVTCLKPEGAFYAFPRLPIKDSEDFAKWILEKYENNGETVMIAPAPGFYATPGLGLDEIRIAYVLNSEDMAHSMELLKNALEKYNN